MKNADAAKFARLAVYFCAFLCVVIQNHGKELKRKNKAFMTKLQAVSFFEFLTSLVLAIAADLLCGAALRVLCEAIRDSMKDKRSRPRSGRDLLFISFLKINLEFLPALRYIARPFSSRFRFPAFPPPRVSCRSISAPGSCLQSRSALLYS